MTFLFRLDVCLRVAAGGVKDLAAARICIHARKLNRANIPPPASFFFFFFFVYNATLMVRDLSTCYPLFSGMICFS